MVLSCGHNFCRHCLAQLGPEVSCPQCRAKVEPSSEESSGQRLCQEHRQPLQSFCSREKSLLCPGCLEGHQGHPLLSLPEAAQQYKVGTNSLGFSIRHRGSPKSPERWEELPGSSERPTKATKFRNGGGEPAEGAASEAGRGGEPAAVPGGSLGEVAGGSLGKSAPSL
uniref:RING-type domain-containing protein n=1 Tax=Naja naja TaxID=35670 RepID=A0A8C6VES6_NAJNA